MDALRRAEAEKKQAAKNKHADQAESVASNSNASIETDSQSVEHDDEDLGATVKLDRLPLPISKKQSESPSSIEVEDVAATASLDDLNVDFDSTSPRVRVTESTPSESANDEQTHDFSINAEFETERFEPAYSKDGSAELSLEPLQEEARPTEKTSPSAPIGSTKRSANTSGNSQPEPAGAESDIDPLLLANSPDATLETSNGQTAVSANTIFEAGASGISRRVIYWAIALGLAVIGLLGISGLYYFQQTPTTRALPSPAASVELERARETVNGSLPSSSLKVENADSSVTSKTEVAVSEIQGETVSSVVPAPPGATQTAPEPTPESQSDLLVENMATTVELKDERSDAKPNVRQPPPVAKTSAETSTNTISTTAPTVNTKRLKIAKSIRAAKSSEKVSQAYEAYRANDFESARALYEQAISIRPQDTNALNGLAALALRENDKERAHELYSKALKFDPNNATAKTAIFQIEGGVGNRVTESQLKLLLDEGGDPGAINFALGTLYSRHTRWNDAQLAFFEAVRHRPNNPDYLYNLAVSLDQMGQRGAAKDFYQQALAASDETSAGFNPTLVLSRIQAISTQSTESNTP